MEEKTREKRRGGCLTQMNPRAAVVKEYIKFHQPCTAQQIAKGMMVSEPDKVMQSLSELLESGEIQTIGKTVDECSGKLVAVFTLRGWQV